jgi:type I restriction enzyme, S subunit
MQSQTLPKGWESVKLGEICAITSGHGFKFNEYSNEGVKLLRINNVTFGQIIWDQIAFLPENYIRDYPKLVLNEGDLLIALNRPILGGKLKIGIMKKTDSPAILYQRVGRIDIRDNGRIDLIFLYHLMRTTFFLNELSAKLSGSDQPYINPTEMVKISIPLPPLPIQHQIVTVLEQAEAVNRQRQEADALTGALLQSVFLEMFGDPVKNEKGWKLKKLNDLIKDKKSVSCGPFGSQLKIGEHTNKGVPVLGIDNVGLNKFVQAKPKFITQEKYEQLIAFKVKPDDVLISRTGTIARTCVLPENFGDAIIGPNLLRISLDQNKLLPIFLSVAFNYMPSMIEQILRVSPGATVAVLNTGNLRNINIIVPPLNLQQQFVRVVETVERIRKRQAESGRQIESLKEGLIQKAFSGEFG